MSAEKLNVEFGPIPTGRGHRLVIYGPGGIGKTTLAASAPGPVGFVDLDDSLARLKDGLAQYDIHRAADISDWKSLCDALTSAGWGQVRTIVIDSASRAEEMAMEWVLRHVLTEKEKRCERLEDFGYGKGYQHVFETFNKLLPLLDLHVRDGRNVILVCHDCTTPVPNPLGDDWIRYEPRLQTSSTGKASIRLRLREWADHVLFIGYDVTVSEAGKGRGFGTRTVYPVELPHCMAKSRTLADSFRLEKGDRKLWRLLGCELDAPKTVPQPEAKSATPTPPAPSEDEKGELLSEISGLVLKYNIPQKIQDGWLKYYKVTKPDDLSIIQLRRIVAGIRTKHEKEKQA